MSQTLIPPPREVSPIRPVLNLDELTERCMGNLEFVERVLGRFNALLSDEITEIKQAASSADWSHVAQLGHRVKGAAANVAAHALCDVAARLETVARENDDERVWEEVTAMESEWHRFQTSLPRLIHTTTRTA